MRLPAWILLTLRLMIIPILIATVRNEYTGRPQIAFMNSTKSLSMPARISLLLANTEFKHHKFPGSNSAKMPSGSIFDLLLFIEICMIALVLTGLVLLYGFGLVHYLWIDRHEQEEAEEQESEELQVAEPEAEEEFKLVLPKTKRRRKVAKGPACDGNSSDESNTESIAESGLDFASSSEHYEEEEVEEEEEEQEFRVRDPVMAEIFKEALMNARFDTLTHNVAQLRAELTELQTEMYLKDEQITAINNRLAALETQMETKNDQICLILLFLVIYSLCNSAIRGPST